MQKMTVARNKMWISRMCKMWNISAASFMMHAHTFYVRAFGILQDQM